MGFFSSYTTTAAVAAGDDDDDNLEHCYGIRSSDCSCLYATDKSHLRHIILSVTIIYFYIPVSFKKPSVRYS